MVTSGLLKGADHGRGRWAPAGRVRKCRAAESPSFSSNLARAGVDDRIIDHFMGHQTGEMRRRHQHLFPGEKREALSQLGY
jgi:integrase